MSVIIIIISFQISINNVDSTIFEFNYILHVTCDFSTSLAISNVYALIVLIIIINFNIFVLDI